MRTVRAPAGDLAGWVGSVRPGRPQAVSTPQPPRPSPLPPDPEPPPSEPVIVDPLPAPEPPDRPWPLSGALGG